MRRRNCFELAKRQQSKFATTKAKATDLWLLAELCICHFPHTSYSYFIPQKITSHTSYSYFISQNFPRILHTHTSYVQKFFLIPHTHIHTNKSAHTSYILVLFFILFIKILQNFNKNKKIDRKC